MAHRVPKPTCEVDRHDNDHFEVKLGFHDPRDYDVDIYFFAPPILGLTQNNPKVEFLNSMRSYVRLQIAPEGAEKKDHVSFERVFLESQRLNDILQKEQINGGNIVTAVKNTGVLYETYLKGRAKNHVIKDLSASEISTLSQHLKCEIEQTEKLNTALRSILSSNLSSKRPLPLPDGARPALTRLGDYVSYLMVDYLASLYKRVQDYPELNHLLPQMEAMAQTELLLRKKIGLHVDPGADTHTREEYLYKTGLLKKYFQRVLFIQVKSTAVAKKVFQPLAAVGAGLAAGWFGLFQQAQSTHTIQQMGLTPTWILTVGVVAYIIKDRIKEVSRHFLAHRVEKVLPDIEKILSYDGDAMRSCEVGKIRESIKSLKSSHLPAPIYDARYADSTSGLEAELGEDIIHYNKKILLNKNSKNLQWGLREIIRFSLNNYFQNLDDPFKEISFIDDSGQLRKHETHRVYYAHLVFQVSYKENGKTVSDIKTAKLVLDKQGLVKVSQPLFFPSSLADARI